MELADLSNLIKGRRSIRVWQEKDVPERLLLDAIELATWAPNGGNQQNWRFYIIKNKAMIKEMARIVQTKAELINSWPEAARFQAPAAAASPAASVSVPRPQSGMSFFGNAPAAIAIAAAKYQSQVDLILEARENLDPRAAEMRKWRNIADSRIQSVSSAIAHMLLVFHQMGLGAVWMTGPMQAKKEIESMLKVPPELDIVAFIPVGYPAESPISRGRKAVSEVTEIIR
jgi:nitroreductase